MMSLDEWMRVSLCVHCSDPLSAPPKERAVRSELIPRWWAHWRCEAQARAAAEAA